jgi:hypothetical protein
VIDVHWLQKNAITVQRELSDAQLPWQWRASAFLGSLSEELRRLVLNDFTAALRATQVHGFMLGDVFDMLENLAALRATVSVGRHGAAPS